MQIPSEGTVIVDFWAEWCAPCSMIAQSLDQIEDEFSVQIVRVNIEENRADALAHGIQSIPTLIKFENGKEVSRLIGAYPKAAIIERLAL